MKLLIPAAGRGERFREAGYTTLKPLIKVYDPRDQQNKTMIEAVADSFLNAPISGYARTKIDQVRIAHPSGYDTEFAGTVNRASFSFVLNPRAEIGQSMSILTLLQGEDPMSYVLISNSDVVHDFFYPRLITEAALHGAVFACTVFESTDPSYSYVNSAPYFEATAEKCVISNYAISGLYYGRVKEIQEALWKQVAQSMNSELFFSEAISFIEGRRLAIVIHKDQVTDLGTPEKLKTNGRFLEV